MWPQDQTLKSPSNLWGAGGNSVFISAHACATEHGQSWFSGRVYFQQCVHEGELRWGCSPFPTVRRLSQRLLNPQEGPATPQASQAHVLCVPSTPRLVHQGGANRTLTLEEAAACPPPAGRFAGPRAGPRTQRSQPRPGRRSPALRGTQLMLGAAGIRSPPGRCWARHREYQGDGREWRAAGSVHGLTHRAVARWETGSTRDWCRLFTSDVHGRLSLRPHLLVTQEVLPHEFRTQPPSLSAPCIQPSLFARFLVRLLMRCPARPTRACRCVLGGGGS